MRSSFHTLTVEIPVSELPPPFNHLERAAYLLVRWLRRKFPRIA